MPKITRRIFIKWFLMGVSTFLAYVAGRPVFHLSQTAINDTTSLPPFVKGFVDDASKLNKTKVKSILFLSGNTQEVEEQLTNIIAEANDSNSHIALAAARHTMGGHTIYPDGIILDTENFNEMHLDEQNGLLQVQSGATWSQVIPYLDSKGYSPTVMQANNDFSVGGTISANAHGWQTNRPPIGSTVESLRLVKADGKAIHCSRKNNKDIFSLAIGGYGLFGFISDVKLRVVKNESYTSRQHVLKTKDYVAFFQENVHRNPKIKMAFGRLSTEEDEFLEEALIYIFESSSKKPEVLQNIEPEKAYISKLKRLMLRGSAGNDYGKALRWSAEKAVSEQVGRESFSRNELQNKSAKNIMNFSKSTTDILHEYFLPFDGFYDFTRALSRVVKKYRGDLLNITIRDVKKDDDAFLQYAKGKRLALVLLFLQERTSDGEKNMQAMTKEIIDEALKLGGTYYLPYRLHATKEQMRAAYPLADDFFKLKKEYDPKEIFQNQFYTKYA